MLSADSAYFIGEGKTYLSHKEVIQLVLMPGHLLGDKKGRKWL